MEERPGHAYSLGAWRRQGGFGESLVAALRAAGLKPDSFLPEYGPRQYELTIAPQPALKAADQAVIARELARATAFRLGHRVSFSPMPVADGVGKACISISACMMPEVLPSPTIQTDRSV